MMNFAELFGDEISELKNKAKVYIYHTLLLHNNFNENFYRPKKK